MLTLIVPSAACRERPRQPMLVVPPLATLPASRLGAAPGPDSIRPETAAAGRSRRRQCRQALGQPRLGQVSAESRASHQATG